MSIYGEVPIHNTRSPDMWNIIEKCVDFTDKAVVDIGCGYGDFVWRAWLAGASVVMGIDKDEVIVKKARERLAEAGFHPPRALITFHISDLEEWPNIGYIFGDIAFCFSVLPYCEDFHSALRIIYNCFEIALIECQYFEDGPGKEITKNDADMLALLKWAGWEKVDWIGATKVKEDRFTRSIWRCGK